MALDLNDLISLTDDDNVLTVFRDSGDTVSFNDQGPAPSASDAGAEVDGFTTYTYFDDSGSIMAKVHVQDDPVATTG